MKSKGSLGRHDVDDGERCMTTTITVRGESMPIRVCGPRGTRGVRVEVEEEDGEALPIVRVQVLGPVRRQRR